MKLGTLIPGPSVIPLVVGWRCGQPAGLGRASPFHFAGPKGITQRQNSVLKYHLLYYHHDQYFSGSRGDKTFQWLPEILSFN